MVKGIIKEGVSVLEKMNKDSHKANAKHSHSHKKNQRDNVQNTVLASLAIIAIVLVLMLTFGRGITGAAVGLTGAATTPSAIMESSTNPANTVTKIDIANEEVDTDNSKEDSTKTALEAKESNRNIPIIDYVRTEDPIAFELDFSKVPDIDATVSLSDLRIQAEALGSSIRINGDLVEAKTSVTIDLSEFVGRMKVNEHTVSLEGTISQIHLNGVSLLSETEIEIEIDALTYQEIETQDITFSYLYLPSGDGDLQAINRLSYELEDDAIDIYDFYGEMTISDDESTPFSLQGDAESLESSSNLLQLGIQ